MLTEFRTLSSAIIGKDLTVRESLTARDITTQSVQFDISQTNIPETGQLIWNAEENTLRLGLNNDVDLDIGEENIVDVKATEIIKRGQCVYASGAVGGGSGHIEVSLYKSQFGFTNEIYFLGVAAQDLNANDFGYATTFGKIREVLVSDTRGSDDPQYGLSVNNGWEIGTILYPSVTDLGKYTQTRPSAPNRALAVAMIIGKNGNKRIFYVRSEHGYDLSDLHDIKITNPQDKQILTYNKTLSTWENKSDITVTSLSATTIHALSSFVEVIDIKQYELSGFNVKGDATVEGRVGITDITSAGSGSLSGSALDIAQTWNTSGTPTAIKLNVTDTASNASSLLMDLRVGGSSRFNVRKDGRTSINGDYTIVQRLWINNDVGFMSIGSASAGDVQLWRDATNIFAQRRSTNAQEFRLYNTYTDASNYERLSFKANTGGAYTIASEAAGTGFERNIALMGGNVGIGIDTPTYKLSIKNDSNQHLNIGSSTSDNGTGLIGVQLHGPNPDTYGKNFIGNDQFGNFYLKQNTFTLIKTTGSHATELYGNQTYVKSGNSNVDLKSPYERISMDSYGVGAIRFFSGGSGNFERMRINNAGNVGIGTTAPTSKLSILDTTLAGSAALSGSALDIAQTWNTTGTPTAIKLNVTDTASNANSLLMDLQVGGSSLLQVSKSRLILHGNGGSGVTGVQFQPIASAGSSTDRLRIDFGTNAFLLMDVRGGINAAVRITGGSRRLSNISALSFTDSNNAGTQNTTIWEEANQTLGMRASTNPQEFRLYNTYTDASNYERLSLKANTGSAYTITSQAAGTGSVRDIALMGGNVGIGTTTPTQKIDVLDGQIISTSSSNANWWVKMYQTSSEGRLQSGGNLEIMCGNGANIFIKKHNTTVLTVAANDNVGIGTTAPSAKLDILNTSTQLRLSYDISNFSTFETGSTGNLTIQPSGSYIFVTSKRIAFGTGGSSAFLDQATEGEIRIRNVSNNDFRNLKLKNLNATGDIESETIGNGVIIKSPNGTRWRITVDDAGELIPTPII